MLGAVPLSEDTQYRVELFVKPVFGNRETDEPHYWMISSPLNPANTNSPNADTLLCYSVAEVRPPEIPNQMTEDDMTVWECYRMETELLFAPATSSLGILQTEVQPKGVQGPQMYFWAVGGQPLEVLGVAPKDAFVGPSGQHIIKPPASSGSDPAATRVISGATQRALVTGENYPIEMWVPDPSRNDNCRYFGRAIGGGSTPPVISFSNTSTVPLLDEHGVGILGLKNRFYLTTADMTGVTEGRVYSVHARFFRLYFRQRVVRNPYTMNLLYKQVFNAEPVTVTGQKGVTEVTMVEETGQQPNVLQGRIAYPTPFVHTNPPVVTLEQTEPLFNVQQ